MDKIEFRGKRKDNGEWVYGSLLVSKGVNDGKHYIIPKTVSAKYDSAYNALKIGYFIEVDPETVGQFTGIKDENGKKIYEGDLVQVLDYASWEGLYKVVWDEESLMYVLEDAYGDKEKMCEFEHYLVRGNIYENPELLEVVDC